MTPFIQVFSLVMLLVSQTWADSKSATIEFGKSGKLECPKASFVKVESADIDAHGAGTEPCDGPLNRKAIVFSLCISEDKRGNVCEITFKNKPKFGECEGDAKWIPRPLKVTYSCQATLPSNRVRGMSSDDAFL